MIYASSRTRLASVAAATLVAAILPLRMASAEDDGWGDEQGQEENWQGDVGSYGSVSPGYYYPPPPVQYYYGPPQGYYAPPPPTVYYGPPSVGFQFVVPIDHGD